MNTPIYDFVQRYSQSGTRRLHMPGHKGTGPLGCEALDITEIQGADELYQAEGIIAASEANAAALFGSGATFYSTEGSSHCIRAMVALAVQGREKPLILAARNAHRAFLTACALLDCEVSWLYPTPGEGSLCSCPISPEALEAALMALPEKPVAFYCTSPDYLGRTADIPAFAEICHRAGVLLLVDNAHGAYRHFLPTPCHPLDEGADLCCDSAHKTLPVLTGGAYLHISKALAPALAPRAKTALALFGSTSPSYLVMQSLDLCNAALAGKLPARLAAAAARMDALKARLRTENPALTVEEGEPLKLVLAPGTLGYTGTALANLLRKCGFEPEYADRDHLVCMVGADTPAEQLDKLESLLCTLPSVGPALSRIITAPGPLPSVMSIRRAMLAPAETVTIEQAEGRICAVSAVSCPPAIALAVSGEVLTKEALLLFKACGAETVAVVKE